MAPSSYITNAAGFSTADFLRRVTTIAYRTRELQISRPDSGIGSAERSLWEGNAGSQPGPQGGRVRAGQLRLGLRFTALNLVLGPTLDNVLLTQLGQVARAQWRRPHLAAHVVPGCRRPAARPLEPRAGGVSRSPQRPENREVLGAWVARWSARADEAALGLGTILEEETGGDVTAAGVAGPGEGGAAGVPRRPAGMMTVRWRDTINLDDLWEGDMTAVSVDGESVLLVNVDGSVRAYANQCPHQASALDQGDLDGETLTCATHLWEFNALTGLGINPDDATLKSYGCQVGDDGTIYVDIGR